MGALRMYKYKCAPDSICVFQYKQESEIEKAGPVMSNNFSLWMLLFNEFQPPQTPGKRERAPGAH